MSKKIIKPIVLSVLFLTALIVFSVFTNKDNKDLTVEMKEATLPIVRCYQGDTGVALLHGYVTKMDSTAMRDTIIPVDNNRILPIAISTYGMKIDGISYEIRSMDGQRLVARNDLTDYKQDGNEIKAELTIQNLLEHDEEYQLIFTLTSEKNELYYYTRLMQTEECYAKECMDFAQQFHEYTFREDADQFISRYMDPATGDTSSLNYVDLTCTLKQITWADFKPEKVGQVNASFKEINSSYNVITLEYVVAHAGDDGQTEYYSVEEYYRLRMTQTRMYVLNFERTMNQIFRGQNNFISDNNRIQLGIRDKEIEYAVSETGDIIAFVQEGELWCFDRINNKIVQVFSFFSAKGMDERESWDQHDIKIARVDEAGSVDFVVYGYMNRGSHEGEVGTAVYHYDGIVHTIEEEVFIPTDKSYEILKAQMGQLLYVNDQGMLYLMLDKNLYSVDLNTLTPTVLVENLKENCYKISESNQYFAWVESEKEYQSEVIHLMDMKSGTVYEIKEQDGIYLHPLGFIDDDFIYGAAKKDKVVLTAAGKTVFPMSSLKIMGTSEDSHNILKEYKPNKGKIESISIEDYTIKVHLMKKSGGHYVDAGYDSIMNREADTQEKVSAASTITEVWETRHQLVMKNPAESAKIKMLTAREVILEAPRNLIIEEKKSQERFYVYQKGDVILATESISDAIICANEKLGVVVDSNQQYVWMRARKSIQNPFTGIQVNEADENASTVVQAVSALLNYRGMSGLSVKELIDNGSTPKSVMESSLKDSVVLDVSGCTVDEIVFYVSKGSPVFAMTGGNSAVLVTGYSANRIYYYDPAARKTLSKSYEDADRWFEDAGNIFFTYLDY